MGKAISFNQTAKIKSFLNHSETLVLATGVFDLIHQEHRNFLKKAKSQGDHLFVGIETDVRVKKLKGKNRPLNSQEKRLQTLASFSEVDYVFILPETLSCKQGREAFISQLRPDIYAVSSNTPFLREKERIMKKFGGKLKVVHQHNPKISTTRIVTSGKSGISQANNKRWKKEKNKVK